MMLLNKIILSINKRLLMLKGKNGIIAILILLVLLLAIPYVAPLFEKQDAIKNIPILSLEQYEIGYLIESDDIILLNRDTRIIDFFIDSSLSIEIIRMPQKNYEKSMGEKK